MMATPRQRDLFNDNLIYLNYKEINTSDDTQTDYQRTAACIAQHLMQMLCADVSRDKKRDLFNHAHHSRIRRWVTTWVEERLTNLTSRGSEAAAKELYGALKENIALWAIMVD